MTKILFAAFSVLFIFSCSSNNSDDDSYKESTLYYNFSSSSITDPKNDDEKIVYITIDGITHTNIAPFDWNYKKTTSSNETHIKVKTNSSKNTTLTYQIIKDRTFDDNGYIKDKGTVLIRTGFKDKLDTIIKIR